MLTVNQLTLTHRKDLTVLVDSLSFTLNDGERLALIGEEGNGKSTLLHLIRNTLEKRSDLRVFYMPQDAGDLLDFSLSPVELLSPSGKKEERSRAGILLGSTKFTADEMNHPSAGLSGGQKAKLMFLMMAESGANVLLLDEPTRNLSPLSGPVIRELLAEYPGCIITVSHDRRLIQEVCTRTVTLTPEGVRPSSFCDNF
ncbi:MAG: ATP-binding cassette domain-containing protein [Christensenellales bacterium]